MTASTLPRLRPVPVVEPRAATRLVEDAAPGRPAFEQGVLPLPVPLAALAGAAPVDLAPGARPVQSWALHFTQVALEVAAGLRQPVQLARWTAEDVQVALRRRHALARRSAASPPRGTVRSVHVTHPARGVAEVAAVVTDGVRCRALAFRMEGAPGRWRVTALELG